MHNSIIESLLIFLLRRINPRKPLGSRLFEELARLTWSVAFEAVALRKNTDGQVEVYLTKRAHTESAYYDLWHVPGSIFRPGESLWDVVDRLRLKEFFIRQQSVKFVKPIYNENDEIRGSILSLVYLVELEEDDRRGKWYSVDRLPADIVQFHKNIVIPEAINYFLLMNK
jgi:ADP-ribose pyrophosphatase YjhB (NUDIX family)